MRGTRVLALVAAVAMLAASCGGSSGGSASGRKPTGQITVFAASSLTGAFQKIAADYQAVHPGTTIRFNFGPSDSLATQIQQAGGADVFAPASPTYMQQISSSPGTGDVQTFARNDLVVIVPAQNPSNVSTLNDIAKPGVKLILAAQGVPVGDYAKQMLSQAGILKPALANVVSYEQDDASLVQKIVANEADAAVVYASDVTAQVAPLVHTIAIPSSVNVTATYQIATVTGSSNTTLGQDFVSYVMSPTGQKTLQQFRFLPPS
jgi:molybdate transport system substrate-binding protein